MRNVGDIDGPNQALRRLLSLYESDSDQIDGGRREEKRNASFAGFVGLLDP